MLSATIGEDDIRSPRYIAMTGGNRHTTTVLSLGTWPRFGDGHTSFAAKSSRRTRSASGCDGVSLQKPCVLYQLH